MAKISRAQEREERRKMSRGLTISIVALVLCWVPVLGIILAAAGFIGVMGCLTEKHIKRWRITLVVVSIILVLCAFVLTAEVYAYSRNPNIIQETGTWLLETITGQHADDYNYSGGVDYSGMDYQGLGMDTGLFGDGYFDAEGNFIPY